MKNIHRRSTLLGIGIGAAGTLAYLASCGDAINVSRGNGADTGTSAAADQVMYANARSGLHATTVQAALDEIGTTLLAATAGTSTWSVQVSALNTETEALDVSSAGTVTFTESAPGQGSYTTSGGNVIMKEGMAGLGELSVSNGKYFIVDDVLFVSAKPKSGGRATGFSWRVKVSDGGNTMTMFDGTIFMKFTKN